MSQGRKVLLSSLKMAVATFASRILGLVREQVMAAMFGASWVTDAFLVAYRIPNLLRDLFAEGAFSSAFVPTFTEIKLKDPLEARRLMWSMVLVLGCVTGIISIGTIIFAPELIGLFAPKFVVHPEKYELSITLLRIMAPFLVFVSLAALFMGVLNTLKIFFIPSLAPAFFNVIMILSMWFLPPVLVENGFNKALSLGIGVVTGGLIQLLIQVPLIFKNNFGPIKGISFYSPQIKQILNRIGIGTIGIAATQINLLINTILASSTVVGAVSWLIYSFRLFQFPVGILSVSLAGSNLVHFSEAWKNNDKEEAKKVLNSTYVLSFVLVLPAFALLSALSTETVHLIFERGAFTSQDTSMTTIALNLYLLSLPFYGLYKIFGPVFYTLDEPQIPVFTSVFCILVNIIFCVSLTSSYGFKILALGLSLIHI